MIIAYKNNEIAEVEIRINNDRLTISGTIGQFLHEDNLYDNIEDFWDEINLESEFGYMADDQVNIYELNEDEIEDERAEYLEGLKQELKDNHYPYEIHKWFSFWVMTCECVGQCKEEIKNMIPIINKSDFEVIMSFWEKDHLKEISSINQKLLVHIMKKYDQDEIIDKLVEIFDE